MIQIGYALSGLIAAAILFLGARFWLAPATASAAFGIADSPPPSTGFTASLFLMMMCAGRPCRACSVSRAIIPSTASCNPSGETMSDFHFGGAL